MGRWEMGYRFWIKYAIAITPMTIFTLVGMRRMANKLNEWVLK